MERRTKLTKVHPMRYLYFHVKVRKATSTRVLVRGRWYERDECTQTRYARPTETHDAPHGGADEQMPDAMITTSGAWLGGRAVLILSDSIPVCAGL